MANKFQTKRTTISGRTPNTTNSGNTHYIDTGELALNLTDGKMFSSNGSAYFEVGANLQNLSVTGNATIKAIIANGSIGTSGQILASNGSAIYWTASGGNGSVTQVNTGNGLTGGPITTTGTVSVLANNGITSNSTGLFVTAGTGTVVNATGVHVNSSYIATISANNTSFLGGTAAASFVQNTDSRTLSGNLVISGSSLTPASNTILLGNSTQRWVLTANTIDASGLITGGAGATITGQVNASTGFGSGTINATSNGLFANATTISVGNSSVNVAITPSTIDLGTQFDANSTGLYHTGTVNAASHTVGSNFIANSTAIVGTGYANVTTSVNSALLTVGTAFIANTTGAYHTGTVNAASHTVGTSFIANSTTVLIGNTTSGLLVSGEPSLASFVGKAGYAQQKNFAVDDSVYGIHVESYNNNTAYTSAAVGRGMYGAYFYTVGNTQSTNTAGGFTNNYITGVYSRTINAPSGGNARAANLYSFRAEAINNADGAVANTIDNLYAYYGEATVSGTGITTKTYGSHVIVGWDAGAAGANIVSAYGYSANVKSSTGVTIDTGYLYYGTHSGSNTTTKYGLYLSNEANNYLSANLRVGDTITADQINIGTSSFIANSSAIIAGDPLTPTANTILLGNSTQRWVLSANTGDFTGTVSGTVANMSTSVNSALLTVGTSFIANTTGAYHTGLVNAASINIGGSGFIANSTAIVLAEPVTANATTGTAGQALLSNGTVGSPYWGTPTSSPGATYVQNTDSRTLSGNLVISGTYFNPSANTILLGNTIQRWVLDANTIDASGLITGGAGATITGQVNASTGFGSGTINATSNGLIANSTTITVGNSSVNVSITPSDIALGTQFDANSTGLYHTGTVNAASHTVGSNFIANSTAIVGTGYANVTTSVNSALFTVGTSFIANTTGAYHTGTINAASHTTTGFVANTTVIAPTSNTILLGNTIGRFVVSANTINASGLITGSAGADITGQVNASTGFGSGTINATSNGLFANSTTISLGNSSVNVAITTAGITSSGSTGINPSSNTVGTALGTATQRWVLNANTIICWYSIGHYYTGSR